MPAAHVNVVILLGVEAAATDCAVALHPLELLAVHLLQRLLVVNGGSVEVERRYAVKCLGTI